MGKKRDLKQSKSGATGRVAKKSGSSLRPTKKGSRRSAVVPSDQAHNAVFASLSARSNQHNQAPVCYEQLSDGSWMICFIQSDGSYAQCQPYTGPIHQPPCGS